MVNDEYEQRKKMYRRRRGGQHSSAARGPVEGEALTTDTESGSKDDIYQHPLVVGPKNDEPLPPINNLPRSEEYNNQEKRDLQCIVLLLCIVVILAVYMTLGIGEPYASKRSFVILITTLISIVQWTRVSGTVVKVTVVYDSSSNVLSAIALRAANLPEKVKFGFSSAGSLDGRQTNLIRSWSFTSTLRSGAQRLNNGTNIEQATSLAQTDETTTFSFNSFRRGDPLIELQGNARILFNGDAQLADNVYRNSGRVLYSRPVRLWDRTTGNVASFMTSFSFTMRDAQGLDPIDPADGIVFFIAPENIQLTSEQGIGGALGLADPKGVGQFVGVEFDNFINSEFRDPPYAHVGIDVNSVISYKTVEWERVSGSDVEVTVIYDSSTKILSTAVTNENGDITTIVGEVDLRAANLPEMVKFGISSSTGDGRQVHLIRSWSFTSTLRSGSQTITNNNNGTNIEHGSDI
ncbi:hypothetical protein PIB30_001934 [Stylosanthes scabra]|uniref:Legume lectin domain-containing protein n=1 Tax=Stylosanthes scabra TaxID=79078 RepID=A0ABU6Y0Z8_9FABA|nr:hypothetical protein [Stylosanthes scabra]